MNRQQMARMGRNGDTEMVHAARGEMMVPPQILDRNPALRSGINQAFADAGADPRRYMVGSPQNSMNPSTGQPEFFLSDLISIGSSILGSDVGKSIATNLIGDLIMGRKPDLKGAAASGLLSGIGSALFDGGSLSESFGLDALGNLLSESGAQGGSPKGFGQSIAFNMARDGTPLPRPRPDSFLSSGGKSSNPILQAISSVGGDSKGSSGIKLSRDSGIGDVLGNLLNLDSDSKLVGLLNTRIGGSLAAGAGAQILDSLFGDDEEEKRIAAARARRNRPFGGSDKPYTVNFMRSLAEGGEAYPEYFPRRNGGIMPEEGSGTKDDVPAMLMAGEFVLTKDAIKGLGGGNQRTGIERAYKMQDALERRA